MNLPIYDCCHFKLHYIFNFVRRHKVGSEAEECFEAFYSGKIPRILPENVFSCHVQYCCVTRYEVQPIFPFNTFTGFAEDYPKFSFCCSLLGLKRNFYFISHADYRCGWLKETCRFGIWSLLRQVRGMVAVV